jgi:hypothetical protein
MATWLTVRYAADGTIADIEFRDQPPRPDPYRDGVWTKCPCCDSYWCRRHFMHAYDCACPPLEEWKVG